MPVFNFPSNHAIAFRVVYSKLLVAKFDAGRIILVPSQIVTTKNGTLNAVLIHYDSKSWKQRTAVKISAVSKQPLLVESSVDDSAKVGLTQDWELFTITPFALRYFKH